MFAGALLILVPGSTPRVNAGRSLGLLVILTAELGTFEEVLAQGLPQPYRRLLAHHEHMTVSVEKHHGCPVDVEVITAKQSGDYYSRKIILHRQTDRRVVLFGIPRLNLRLVDDVSRGEIAARTSPRRHDVRLRFRLDCRRSTDPPRRVIRCVVHPGLAIPVSVPSVSSAAVR